jgi:hypothetical protein
MLPSWVTLVVPPVAGELAAVTLFVCASTGPPQDNAATEITAQYFFLRSLFFFFAKAFINFNG